MLKTLAAPLRPVPQWSAVAVESPQRSIAAILSGDGAERDVTANHSVASLTPLTIASGVDAGDAATLDYRFSGRSLGRVHLVKSGALTARGAAVSLYRVTGGDHRCLPWPWRPWNRWRQKRVTQSMDPDAVQQLMICYICPRPVVLVSVAAPGHFNIFPMDLIGAVGSGFTLALRKTNYSIPVLSDVRRAVLSSVPAQMKEVAYKLGEHHKLPLKDWAELPFATRPSPTLGIPAVADAVHIRELAIRHVEEIGSHIFFVADILSDTPLRQEAQLHHTAGFHQAFRRRRGTPFTDA